MKEFHEPMLYLSTPEHPNTMCILAILQEPIDGDVLQSVVEELRSRFPYFYVKATIRDNDIYTEMNPLPITVRNIWSPIKFNSYESNYHLAAWKYEGKRLAFEISHSLTDGAGVLPYMKSVLYLYLSQKTGQVFNSAGFRLPGDLISASEIGNPFQNIDLNEIGEPPCIKQATRDFYRLKDRTDTNPQAHYIKLSEQQLMQCCHDFNGTPNALLAVLLARTARQYDSKSEKTITVSIAVDHKAMLGVYDNYRLFAGVIELDFPKDEPLDDLVKACRVARRQIKLQANPENSLWALKERKNNYAKLDQLPLDMKLKAMAKAAGNARWSFSVSYMKTQSMEVLDSYIDALYTLTEPVVADICCNMTCINHNFFLAVVQSFSANRFIDAFLSELSFIGIKYEVTHRETLSLCGIEAFKSHLNESHDKGPR